MAKEKKTKEVVETGSESPAIIIHKKNDWLSVFRTQVEAPNGEHYMGEIQQDTLTKEIRIVKV